MVGIATQEAGPAAVPLVGPAGDSSGSYPDLGGAYPHVQDVIGVVMDHLADPSAAEDAVAVVGAVAIAAEKAAGRRVCSEGS